MRSRSAGAAEAIACPAGWFRGAMVAGPLRKGMVAAEDGPAATTAGRPRNGRRCRCAGRIPGTAPLFDPFVLRMFGRKVCDQGVQVSTYPDWSTEIRVMTMSLKYMFIGQTVFVKEQIAGVVHEPYEPLPQGRLSRFQGNFGSHEVGEYEGFLRLTDDFETHRISGKVSSLSVSSIRTPARGSSRPFANVSMPYEFNLGSARFDERGFTGTTTVTSTDPGLPIPAVLGAESFPSCRMVTAARRSWPERMARNSLRTREPGPGLSGRLWELRDNR